MTVNNELLMKSEVETVVFETAGARLTLHKEGNINIEAKNVLILGKPLDLNPGGSVEENSTDESEEGKGTGCAGVPSIPSKMAQIAKQIPGIVAAVGRVVGAAGGSFGGSSSLSGNYDSDSTDTNTNTNTNTNTEEVNYEGYDPNTKEILFTVENPLIAMDIGTVEKGKNNISTISHRFASSGKGDNALEYKDINGNFEGTEVNAFRHTLWQASITAKYGSDIAKEVGDAHERSPKMLKTDRREFETLAEADQMVDLLNNQIGRQIGNDKHPNMKELSVDVLKSFHNDGLYVVEKSDSKKFVVNKKRITEEKYNYMKEVFDKLNEYGKEN